MDVDALAFVLFGDGFLDHGVEVSQEVVVPDEEVGFATEGVEHACHFDGDVTCADERYFLGLSFELEETVRGYAHLATWNILRDCGVATGCEEDLFGVDGRLGAVVESDFDFVLAQQMSSSVDVLDFVIVEILFIYSIKALDVGVTLVLKGGPVKGGSSFDREAISFGFMDGFSDRGGVPGDFFWDTASSTDEESTAVS